MLTFKKRFISVVAALALSATCIISFSACVDDSGNSDKPAAHREAENAVTKKGVCVSRYNDGKESSAEKIESINPSWYYTWGVKTENENIDAEFVPMIWGGWDVTKDNLDYIKENYESGKFTHLLTFNEPDLPDQSNMSVEEALSYWEKLEEIGIPLSSPVVSTYYQNNAWLDEFMEKATERGLRVDFIAVHSYQPFYLPNMAESLKTDTLDVLYEKYHKPIWLTEFGAIDIIARDIPNRNELMEDCTAESTGKYIKETTDMLEQCGYVERYSWFVDNMKERGDARPFEAVYTSLFNDDDTISRTGEAYKNVKSNIPLFPEIDQIKSAKVGKEYSQQIFVCGGTGDYVFTASGLPEGLSISKAGRISGKTEAKGIHRVQITVTDSADYGRVQNLTREYTLTVE